MRIDTVSITTCLQEISLRLTEAHAIARAAVTCAETGAPRDAMRIAMDLDELLHEVTTLHGAMVLFGRIERRATGGSGESA